MRQNSYEPALPQSSVPWIEEVTKMTATVVLFLPYALVSGFDHPHIC